MVCARDCFIFLEKIKQNPSFKNLSFDPFKILSQTQKMVKTLHKYSAFKPAVGSGSRFIGLPKGNQAGRRGGG